MRRGSAIPLDKKRTGQVGAVMTGRSLLLACGVVLGLCGPAAAEQHRLQPDFTFKRIGAPPPGAPGRITVQIGPRAPAGPEAPPAAGTGDTAGTEAAARAPSRPANSAWFWQIVSPDLSASGPGRLAEGLRALRQAPDGSRVPAPRLQGLTDIAAAHGTDILLATVGTDVSPALALAVISVESAGREDAVSSAGATGLMQLMPATAERFGVTDRLDGAQNIKGGVAYLDWLMEEFGGDPILFIAAYNAGEGAVRSNDGVPPYAETRDYVPKVLAAWEVAKGLCMTPPELMTDGCVFQTNGN